MRRINDEGLVGVAGETLYVSSLSEPLEAEKDVFQGQGTFVAVVCHAVEEDKTQEVVVDAALVAVAVDATLLVLQQALIMAAVAEGAEQDHSKVQIHAFSVKFVLEHALVLLLAQVVAGKTTESGGDEIEEAGIVLVPVALGLLSNQLVSLVHSHHNLEVEQVAVQLVLVRHNY